VDIAEAEGVLVCEDEAFAGRRVGRLTYWFQANRITKLESEHHNDYVQAMWTLESGDKDRIGEVNLGLNPALQPLPGRHKLIPYFGYGAGVVRISLGDNLESGGCLPVQLSPMAVSNRCHAESQ